MKKLDIKEDTGICVHDPDLGVSNLYAKVWNCNVETVGNYR